MKETIEINIYYMESGKRKILDKECMIEEMEAKIAGLVESGEYNEA